VQFTCGFRHQIRDGTVELWLIRAKSTQLAALAFVTIATRLERAGFNRDWQGDYAVGVREFPGEPWRFFRIKVRQVASFSAVELER
jgi:hypothetical protein